MPQKPTIPRICLTCSSPFLARSKDVQLGFGKWCGIACRSLGKLIPLADRFWPKVDKNGPIPSHCPEIGPCWIWTGYCDPNGYGRISVQTASKPERTHRVSWVLHFGSIPDGLSVLHKCDNRSCVNPSHFFLGNHAINAQDMVAKGRNYQATAPELVARGERSHHSNLTEVDVRAIRQQWATGGMKQRDIAALYGVTPPAISAIVTRRNWKHVA